jgi:hypothetical protein
MRWNQGREAIDRMLAENELQRVPASREHADRLVLQATANAIASRRRRWIQAAAPVSR